MYRFIQAIRRKDTVAFKERLRSADVLLIDDIQFICDKDSTQEEFLHTLNALLDHRCQVVFSADRAPSRLEGMEGGGSSPVWQAVLRSTSCRPITSSALASCGKRRGYWVSAPRRAR